MKVTQSRNNREGWYHGCEERHRRVPRWFSLRNRKILRQNDNDMKFAPYLYDGMDWQ